MIAAFITAGAAVTVSVWSYLSLNRQKKLESLQKLREQQSVLYIEVITLIQKLMNATDANKLFEDFQDTYVKILVQGDDDTAKAVRDYFNALVDSTRSEGTSLHSEKHEHYQANIINSMRKSQKLCTLENIRLVSFKPK